MPKDKLIHTIQMSIEDQQRLMSELTEILDTTAYGSDDGVAFLEHIIHNLGASINQCLEKERQYEQAIALERGEA